MSRAIKPSPVIAANGANVDCYIVFIQELFMLEAVNSNALFLYILLFRCPHQFLNYYMPKSFS